MTKWEYTEAELWRYGENDISIYHVFGTIAVKNTVLAFAEARYGDGSDAKSFHDIVMRKSVDGGKSFADNVRLLPSEEKYCWVNPVPIYDEEIKRLFLFYCHNDGNIYTNNYLIYSDDLGESWSDPKCIDDLFDSPFNLAGPGHGIQLKNGEHKGRLIMQFWHRYKGADVPAEERGYCVSLLRSDDHGESWTHGDYKFGEWMSNESRITETDSRLIWNMRTMARERCVSYSYDGGDTWGDGAESPMPPAKVCDAGMVSLSAKEGYENVVLVSRVGQFDSRRDMEIRISYDGGESFTDVFTLMPGDAMPGYSDMCVIDDGEPIIGLLHCRNNHVMFSRISLQTLTGGKYDNTSRTVWLK